MKRSDFMPPPKKKNLKQHPPPKIVSGYGSEYNS